MSASPPEINRRILVVDDNVSIHADFRKILLGREADTGELARVEAELFGTTEETGQALCPSFELDAAEQGEQAIALARQAVEAGRPFAIAFVDVRMPPGLDGIDTSIRLWEADPDLQIVICTAYSDYSWEQMAERLGGSDRWVILKKPFDPVEVLQLASALTEKRKLLSLSKRAYQNLERVVGERTQELRSSNEELQKEIAERRRTEQTLRATQEKLNHFLAKSPAVLYSLKIDSGTLSPSWISENFLQFTGRPAEDWYRQLPSLEHVEEADRAAVRDGFGTLLVQDSLAIQYRVRRKDGTVRWVRDEQQLVRDSGGQPVEVVGCWTDITEQRLLEEELRQSQKMESVGLLAGGVAHDFNNLLTVIRGHVELLLAGEQLPGNAPASLRQVLAAADRAANLTRQLLAFSRKQIMRPEDLDLNDLIGSLTKLLGRTLGEHISVRAEHAPNLPAVCADRGMIEQVIMNLAVNARDAMPDGGQLKVSTSVREVDEAHAREHSEARTGRFVCMSVADTGCGIAPENLPRVFEPFFTTKEVGKGTGLGLATVYGIVKQHDGWLEVESRVGHGTVFTVFLPMAIKTAGKTAPMIPPPPAKGGNETILIVEDEPALRGLVRTTLQRQGYRVFTAASGLEALDGWSARIEQIDLLLTDMVMPDGVTGLELAKRMQGKKPQLKVIYMSGYSADVNGQEAAVGKGIRFIAKPFGPQALADAVRASLDDALDASPSVTEGRVK